MKRFISLKKNKNKVYIGFKSEDFSNVSIQFKQLLNKKLKIPVQLFNL